MSRVKDKKGQKFGKWEVIKFAGLDKRGKAQWLCRCECGKEKIPYMDHLMKGNSRGCGCKKNNNLRHGFAGKGKVKMTYRVWRGIKTRCLNKNNINYPSYGGRGIKVCERWLKFENFLEDMGECPGQGYSIERIDNDGDYCLENCRWATSLEQNQNKRNNIMLTFRGETLCAAEWARRLNMGVAAIRARKKQGWSDEEALTIPYRQRRSDYARK